MRMRSTSPRKPSDLASGLPYVVRSSLGLPWVPLALGTASAASQLYQDPVIFCFCGWIHYDSAIDLLL